MKRVSIYVKLVLAFIIFLILAFLVKGGGLSDFIKTSLGTASFLFGIILAFSIANRHTRLGAIRSSLREQDAILINIYYLSKTFGNSIVNKVRELMDNLLISQIDYKLEDIGIESPKRLKVLYLFLEKLKSKSNVQKEAKGKILGGLEQLEKTQKEVEYQIKNEMMFYEWISLLVLGGVILFCLFYINVASFTSVIVITFLSTAVVFLLLVLNELDSLTWQERNWIWGPLSKLFEELDLVPYFPEGVFSNGRIKLDQFELKKVRIAHYPNLYPSTKGKKIEIVKVR